MIYHMGVLLIVALIGISYSLRTNNMRNWKKIGIQVITVILSLFLGLRTWWMADIIKYHTQYVNCGGPEWKQHVFGEIGNIGLRWFFLLEHRLTGGNFQIALLLIAFFCMGCLGYVTYKYSASIYWSYLMYIAMGFYFFNFSGLKQSIAMAILLLAFSYIIEGKLACFVVSVFTAGMFHAPALIFFPAYWIARKKIDKKYIFLMVVIFAFVFLLRGQIVTFLSSMYYDEDTVYNATINVGGKFIMLLIMIFMGIVLRKPTEEDKVYTSIFNLIIVATMLQSFSVFGHNFTRLADYYFQFVILYIPFIFEQRIPTIVDKSQTTQLNLNGRMFSIIYIGVSLFAVYFFYNYIRTDISGILDYKFFWEVAQTPWGS